MLLLLFSLTVLLFVYETSGKSFSFGQFRTHHGIRRCSVSLFFKARSFNPRGKSSHRFSTIEFSSPSFVFDFEAYTKKIKKISLKCKIRAPYPPVDPNSLLSIPSFYHCSSLLWLMLLKLGPKFTLYVILQTSDQCGGSGIRTLTIFKQESGF